MNRIEREFNRDFANWDICLPSGATASREAGRIVKNGWTVWYAFGSDEGIEYLDYYASHRMTNDRHVRLYADGRTEGLEAISEFHVVPEDPNEAAQAQADFYARNREVRRMLDEKGFTLEGVVHPSVAINHYLPNRDCAERRWRGEIRTLAIPTCGRVEAARGCRRSAGASAR